MNMPVVTDRQSSQTTALVLNGESLAQMMKLAEIMATGRATLPRHFNGNPADCLAVVMQSMQWQMNPFAVAQKTHVVSGTLGYEAQLVNAVITACAPTKDRLNYEWFGDWEKILGKFVERESKTKKDDHGHPIKYRAPAWDIKDENGLGVKVWATFKGEGAPRELTLLMTQARTRNSTLWADDPRQQLAYLATKRWARLYCPDVIMGVYSPDELEEIEPRDVTSTSSVVSREPLKAATAPAEKAVYPQEKFDENFPKWKEQIEGKVPGKKSTAQGVIARLSTQYTLTEEQRKKINDIGIVDAEAPTAASPSADTSAEDATTSAQEQPQ